MKMNEKQEKTYCVGIGASAGGLGAIRLFFDHMPADSGMAFIVVQHLAPDYESVMNELLASHTAMKVIIAEEGMEIMPNAVYLNSPGKMLLIEGNVFKQKNLIRDKKPLLYINNFFQSLAESKKSHAIAIVLSGTGSDGALGIGFIKENGGMVIAQSEESAEFNGMPHNAIETGSVDFVLDVGDMPKRVLEYVRHPLIVNEKNKMEDGQHIVFNSIIALLRKYFEVDFSLYKSKLIMRRIDRRVALVSKTTITEYYDFLLESKLEREALYKDLLIGVTSFFRDPEVFAGLYEKVIPNLPYQSGQVRAWSVACSTGEEVYSVAINILEYMRINKIQCELKIFATDIDQGSLDVAGSGSYDLSIADVMSVELLARYFDFTSNAYQIKDFVRRSIIFCKHDVLRDAPFSHIDLLVCRNLLIYLKSEVQQKLFNVYHRLLSEKGYLVLGSSESVGKMEEAFIPLDKRWNIYQKNSRYENKQYVGLVSVSEPIFERRKEAASIAHLVGNHKNNFVENVLSQALPTTIIVEFSGHIVHHLNDAEKYIKCGIGRAGQILSSLRGGLAAFVGSILRRITSEQANKITEVVAGLEGFENERITIHAARADFKDGKFIVLQLVSENISKVVEEKFVFNGRNVSDYRIKELETALGENEEKLREAIEQIETRNEELQSSYEEVISSNEELQSTNEELQSVNEELYTVNGEFQNKIQELTRSHNDFDNLLLNAEIGAVFLDSEMHIRRITPVIFHISHLLSNDIGRPISHVIFMSEYPELVDDVAWVAANRKLLERTINDKQNKKWLARIQPYVEDSHAMNGIVIIMFDITRQLEIARYDMTSLSENIPVGVLRMNCEQPYTVIFANQSLYHILGMTRQEDEMKGGKTAFGELTKNVRGLLELKMEQGFGFGETTLHDEYAVKLDSGEVIWLHISGKIIANPNGKSFFQVILLDVTEQKLLLNELKCEHKIVRKLAGTVSGRIWEYLYSKEVFHILNGAVRQDDEVDEPGRDFKTFNDFLTVYPEDKEAVHLLMKEIRAGKDEVACEVRLFKEDSGYQMTKITGRSIKNDSGDLIKMFGRIE